jgi:hypothetical protein
VQKFGLPWAACLIGLAAPGLADEGMLLSTRGDWSVFVSTAPATCWIATRPRHRETPADLSAIADAGGVFLMLTYRRGGVPEFELAYTWGAPFPGDASITLQTALAEFRMFHADGWAWIDAEARQKMAEVALRQAEVLGNDVVVETRNASAGARDQFSTLGLQAALDEIALRCP